MPASYVRLTDKDREEISRGLASGESMAVIADRIGRSTSTISVEVSKNGGISGYRANLAGRRARRKAASRKFGRRKLTQNPALLAEVISGLMSCWSPNQIAKTLRSTYPLDIGCISHQKPSTNISTCCHEARSRPLSLKVCAKSGSTGGSARRLRQRVRKPEER